MALEQDIQENTAAMKALTLAIQSLGGGALVGTPLAGAAGDATDAPLKKTTYFHIAGEKRVVKLEAGAERPIGGLEISAKEAKALEAKYAEGNAGSQTSQTGAAGTQSQAGSSGSSTTGTTSSTQADTGSTVSGPTFPEVQAAMQKLAQQEGKGRESVMKLLKLWGVDTFPKAEGKKSNEALLADIAAEAAPAAAADPMAGLGL